MFKIIQNSENSITHIHTEILLKTIAYSLKI